MDERELQEIEAMQAAGGILPGDVGRLVAEVRRLQAENAALRARAVPALEWQPEIFGNGEEAETKAILCEAWHEPIDGGYNWTISSHEGHVLASGNRPTIDAAKIACEAAFLRLMGVQQ